MSALQFLNKKSWHTATIKNNEKVWKAEQRDKEEKAKLAELQQQLAEEREKEEMMRMQIEAGLAPASVLNRQKRVDWMYEFADVEKEQRKKDQEDYLLGKKSAAEAIKKEEEPLKLLEQKALLQSAAVSSGKVSNLLVDCEAKMREDPLMAMRLEEQKAVQAIINNPVRMEQIRRELGYSQSNHRDDEDRRDSLKHSKGKSKDASSFRHHERHDRHQDKRKYSHHEQDGRKNDHHSKKYRSSHNDYHDPKQEKLRHKYSEEADQWGGRSKEEKYENHHDKDIGGPREHHHRSRDSANGRSRHSRNPDSNQESSAKKYSSSFHRDRSVVDSPRNRIHYRSRHSRHSEKDDRELSYHHKKPYTDKDSSTTQKQHSSKVSDEEKKKKLQEMMDAAKTHEQSREERVKESLKAVLQEENDLRNRDKHNPEEANSFVARVTRDAFGTASEKKLDQMIQRRKNSSQRRHDDKFLN